ncbi:hypothetical protein [Kordia sp.]|uniref:hypothetical protein n=1 Tax=Kordia sp. TaxID=1965332 RepID=UPI003D6BC55E
MIQELAGLQLQIELFKKLNETPFKPGLETSIFDPLVSVKPTDEEHTYLMNIVACIPEGTSLKSNTDIQSAIALSTENKVHLKYNGLSRTPTDITTTNYEGKVICRNFEIVYDCEDSTPSNYEFYLIVVKYTVLNAIYAINAEAVILFDQNVDPELSRGTVTTAKKTK